MTDRQLMGFLTIVEKKSFTAAAEAMYISQSALSQQIRHLERQLGFALFDRSTRQPTLTEAGRSFYERAREIQHLYDRAVAEGKQIQHLSQQHIKRLVIGCLDEQFILIWQDLLTTALPLAQSYAPCPVRYYSKESLYAALLRGEVQIAALLENEDIRRFGLDFLPFAQVTELCMPAGLPLAPELLAHWAKHKVHAEDLLGMQVAFHNLPGSSVYEDALRAHLQKSQLDFVDPHGFRTAGFRETVLLLPAVRRPRPGISAGLAAGAAAGFCDRARGGPQGLGLCGIHPDAPYAPGELLDASAITKAPIGSSRRGLA